MIEGTCEIFMSLWKILRDCFFFLPKLTHEEEEAERRELQKLLSDDKPSKESVRNIRQHLYYHVHIFSSFYLLHCWYDSPY